MESKIKQLLRRPGKFPAVIIDIYANAISLRSVCPESLASTDTFLFLTEAVAPESPSSVSVENGRFDTQHFRDAFDNCVLGHKNNEPLIILGNRTDPFHPVKGKFDLALRLIEQIVSRTAKPLLIQTRSPLVVMSLPILRNNASRIAVTLAIETESDNIHNRYLPSLPRPSERLTAAETLNMFEIPLMIQAAPILGRTISRRRLMLYASSIARLADYIRILPFRDIGDTKNELQRSSLFNTPQSNLAFAISPHQLLTQELAQICPEKITQFGATLFADEHEKEAA